MNTFNTKSTYRPTITRKGTEIVRHVDTMGAKALTHKVKDCGHGDYLVESQSGETYEVTVTQTGEVTEGATRSDLVCTCTCDYGMHRSGAVTCSHTIAAVQHFIGRRIRLYNAPNQTRTPHRPVHYVGDGVWAVRM